MKLFFVAREPHNWSDGGLPIVDPDAVTYSNTLGAANEAERLARIHPGKKLRRIRRCRQALVSVRAGAGRQEDALSELNSVTLRGAFSCRKCQY